jgi:hypothetical protein
LINLPIDLAVMLAAARFIGEFREDGKRRLDWLGFLLSGVALPCILYASDSLSHSDADPTVTMAILCIGLAFGAAAIRHFRQVNTKLMFTSYCRATTDTDAPGTRDAATISRLSAFVAIISLVDTSHP